MFKPSIGVDRSSLILAEISTLAKTSGNTVTGIFIDFKCNPLMFVVSSLGQIAGYDSGLEKVRVWEDTSGLAVELKKLNPIEISGNNITQTLSGLNKSTFDPITNSIFVKTNALAANQRELMYQCGSYIAYMTQYRNIKMSGGVPNGKLVLGKGGKPKNFSTLEYKLFKIGYFPICIFNHSDYPELRDTIYKVLNETPLSEGMQVEQTYNVVGKAIAETETTWVSKRALVKFLQYVRPGMLSNLTYSDLSMKLALTTLFEYGNLITEEQYAQEFGSKVLDLPPVNKIPFTVEPDSLGINRMNPVVSNQ